MGKTFQAAQLTHKRFLTIDHSCKIFFDICQTELPQTSTYLALLHSNESQYISKKKPADNKTIRNNTCFQIFDFLIYFSKTIISDQMISHTGPNL